jgi:Zn-dependent M28 family amino/carboxypeptidase
VFYLSLVPALLILALVFDRTGNNSPGALDDASGEAVILETARLLAQRPLRNLDVRIISFACEEIGLIGSVKYLRAHAKELEKSELFMLNFDMPFSTAGVLGINTGYGVPPHRTSQRLNELARKAAREMNFEVKGIFLPVRAAADHIPWSRHGFEATGFAAISPCMHRSSDSPHGIDREAMRRTGEVTLDMVRELDQRMN